VGADLSPPMIRELKSKSETAGSKSVLSLVCNSGQLPFGDGQFDLVMTQNAPPYPEEMVRVLRPGGRLFLVYSFVFAALVRKVIRQRLEHLGLQGIDFIQAEEGLAAVAVKRGE
jgi:ubiquinone/menaquinone biosynthesis C-methylase UbiE